MSELTGSSSHAAGPWAGLQRHKVLLPEPVPGQDTPSLWSMRRGLERNLSHLPASALRELERMREGYIVVRPGETAYCPGECLVGNRTLQAVAFLDPATFEESPEAGLGAISALLDHLLGSLCRLPERRISEGTAASAAWGDFYPRLLAAHRLGYADDPEARSSPTAYFQWAFRRYCTDASTLQAVDPHAYRLLHSTLFSDAFWRGHPLRKGQACQRS